MQRKPTGARVLLGLAIACATIVACKSPGPRAPAPGTARMTGDEAWALVDELRAERGAPIAQKPVKSLAEALAIVDADDTARFGRVMEFLGRHSDATSLTTRAWVDLLHAEAGLMAAELYGEFVASSERRATPSVGSDYVRGKEAARLARYREAAQALQILARAKLSSGERLVATALEKYPRHPHAHLAAAMLHRMKRDWAAFDATMARLDAAGIRSARMSYLRGAEALYRREDLAAARVAFEDALSRDPKLVRARAHLLLAQDSVAGMYAELERLQRVAPLHFVVLVAGPSIEAEFATLIAGGSP